MRITLLPAFRLSTLLIALILCVSAALAEQAGSYADPPMPPYRIEVEGFDAGGSDIKAVCDSAGRELWKHFPGYKLEKFVVKRGRNGPITLYSRNDQGEIVIKLDTGNTYWCQYAYQFAHEFCHVLCSFDEDYEGNKWFEETLAETASLYALRAMAGSWKTDPPYGHWKDYRDALRSYSDDVILKRMKVHEIYESGLAGFLKAHKERLTKEPCDRDLNGAMSLVFLKLFEEEPGRWESVRWLNSSPSPKGETFEQYLNKWHKAVPNRHRTFVEKVARLFGVSLNAGD
jgi:hypothetical protein